MDRLPPHNTEAEQGVLGCLLAEDGDAFHNAIAGGLKPDWFYDLRHSQVFRAISELENEGVAAGVATVRQKLGADLEAVGGVAYLMALQDATPSSANLPFYLDICQDALLRRKAVAIASQASDMADGSDGGESVLKTIVERATAALDDAIQKESTTGTALSRTLTDHLESRKSLADSGKRSGISTGLPKLDEMTDGLQRGEQFILGARPSAGKTAMGITIAAEIAYANAIPSLIISCEMSTASLLTRLCAVCTGISLSALRYGKYTENDFKKLMAFNERLSKTPLYIYDAINGITGSEAAAVIRQHARRFGVKFALVDYLQKLRPDRKAEKRTYEIGEISGALRSSAVNSGVALLTLAQLNRDSDKGTEPRQPRLSDLADSAQIERDADTVALIHRGSKIPTSAKLLIAKQRDGETGQIDLYFNGPITRFENHSEKPDTSDY